MTDKLYVNLGKRCNQTVTVCFQRTIKKASDRGHESRQRLIKDGADAVTIQKYVSMNNKICILRAPNNIDNINKFGLYGFNEVETKYIYMRRRH